MRGEYLDFDWSRYGAKAMHERLARAEAENKQLREACGSAIWLLNNRHNRYRPQWEEYAKAAEDDLRRALGDTDRKEDG